MHILRFCFVGKFVVGSIENTKACMEKVIIMVIVYRLVCREWIRWGL